MTMRVSQTDSAKPVRLVDVAARAGVSRTTAASVLLDSAGKNARVSESTARRVRSVAREMGYRPNAAAQRLAGKQTKLIGAIIDSYAPAPYFTRLSEMERLADQHGYRFMVGQSHGELAKIKAYAADFVSHGVDGVICLSHDYPNVGRQIADVFAKLPNVVFVGSPLLDSPDVCCVEVDHASAVNDAIDYLVRKGRRRIGMIIGDRLYRSNLDRIKGYREGMKKHDLARDDTMIQVVGDMRVDDEGALRKLCTLLTKECGCDAILAGNDAMALHIIRALRQSGHRVPEDVAVIGFDNLQLSDMTDPPLTTIDQNDRQIATVAMDLLLSLIDNKKLSSQQRRQRVKPKLVVRASA